jgi:hypothetical protein
MNLSSPVSRREALRLVDVDDPGPHHAILREIFDLERTWCEGPDTGQSDEYEHAHLSEWLSRWEDPKIEDWALPLGARTEMGGLASPSRPTVRLDDPLTRGLHPA